MAGWATGSRERVGGEGGPLNIMYRVDGSSDLKEEVLEHWAGYRGSRPVRIGNGAADELQLDIYGEAMDSIFAADRAGQLVPHRGWTSISDVLEWVAANWDQPEEGIWETRGGRQPFTYGRLMCWVAFDRGIRLAAARGLPGPVQRWTTERDRIYAQVHDQGWNAGRRAFVQHYHTDVLDASLLRMPKVGFVAPKDPMWTATLEAMDAELVTDSLVYRYDPAASPDGLRGSEGTFSLCTFAYVDALARAGPAGRSRRCSPTPTTSGCSPRRSRSTGSRSATSRSLSPTWRSSMRRSRWTRRWTPVDRRSRGLSDFGRSAQHDDRARARCNRVTRVPLAVGRDGRRLERVDLRHPLLTRADRRKHELQRLPPGVDEHEEIVVEQRAAVGGVVGRVLTFQVDGDPAGTRVAPLLGGDDRACGGEPPQ